MPKLTKTLVDHAEAPAKGDTFIWDAELQGFGVRIQASGRKTYMVRYRTRDAKRTQRKLTICRCSDMPPDKARDQARKVFAKVAEGGDPVAEMKPVKEQVCTTTVERLFEGYVADMRAKGRASADEVERVLLNAKRNAADALGRTTPVVEVQPMDVVKYLAGYYKSGHRGAADKARSYIASAYSWGMKSANDYTTEARQDWGIIRNPAADVAKDSGAVGTRSRNLSADEIQVLWAATLDGSGGFGAEIGAVIRLLICCGQRVQETLRIAGSEIDLDGALWTMPKEKTKGKKREHDIPLPRQAVETLRPLIEECGDGPLFPSRDGSDDELIGHRSVSQAIRRWLAEDDVEIEKFQTRDLRRTWKSRTHDAGVDRFTRDLIQQHSKGDTGSKVYDHADYLPQMRAAMDAWADWLDEHLGTKPPLSAAA